MPSEASSSLKWIHCKFSMQLSPAHLADVRAGIGEQLGNSMLRRETLCGSPCRPPLTGAGAGCRYNTSLGGVALMFDRLAIKSDLAVISSDAPVVFVPIEAPAPMPLPPRGRSFSPSLRPRDGWPSGGRCGCSSLRPRSASGWRRPSSATARAARWQEMASDTRVPAMAKSPWTPHISCCPSAGNGLAALDTAGHGQITLNTARRLPGCVAEEGRVPCSASRSVAPARRGAREMGSYEEIWEDMGRYGERCTPARGGPEDDESEAALGGPAPPADDSEAFV